jgi:antitoxin VapB
LPRTAKLFRQGRSQAVRLPSDFRFDGNQVYIRKDAATGDVILSRRPDTWQDFFALAAQTGVADDLLTDRHNESPQKRELFG